MASCAPARLAGVVAIAMPSNAAAMAEESIAEGVACVSLCVEASQKSVTRQINNFRSSDHFPNGSCSARIVTVSNTRVWYHDTGKYPGYFYNTPLPNTRTTDYTPPLLPYLDDVPPPRCFPERRVKSPWSFSHTIFRNAAAYCGSSLIVTRKVSVSRNVYE